MNYVESMERSTLRRRADGEDYSASLDPYYVSGEWYLYFRCARRKPTTKTTTASAPTLCNFVSNDARDDESCTAR